MQTMFNLNWSYVQSMFLAIFSSTYDQWILLLSIIIIYVAEWDHQSDQLVHDRIALDLSHHLQLVGMDKRHNGQSLLFSNRWKMQLSRSRCKCSIWVASESTPTSAIQQQAPGDDEVCTLTFSNFSVEVLVAGTNVADPHHHNHHYHPTPQPHQLWGMPPYAQG